MAQGRAVPWPLTNGINNVYRWGYIHAASAFVGCGVRGWARGALSGSKRSMITMVPPQAGQGWARPASSTLSSGAASTIGFLSGGPSSYRARSARAICRTNRAYGEQKTNGLIVDYLGIFGDAAHSLKFDEEGVQKAVSNVAELINAMPSALQKCLAYFAGVDRSLMGCEGLITAQECIPNNDMRDAFAANFSVLARIWEALSPDPVLTQYETDYRWLAQVYECP